MQQIVAEGRLQERCRQFFLSLSPLPRILVPPYSIRDVHICGDIAVTPERCGDVKVSIPLSVLVCDQQGNTHTASSQLTLSVPQRFSGDGQIMQYIAQAHVALCQQPVCFDDPAQVSVCLTVCVQVFGVRMQAMYAPPSCAPACPPLPIYPQPRCH